MYNPKSKIAEEFICNEEILETIKYAQENKNNLTLIDEILTKAKKMNGLNHREATVLLLCENKEKIKEINQLAKQIKETYYGNRVVLFAPIYLSNYCVNGCVYCPYHAKNTTIPRKKMTQEEIKQEVIALQDMGHKRLALETGEDPINNPIEYVIESLNTIYNIKHKNGTIRRVNVNIAATTVENYKKLHDAGIGTYVLFQETYKKDTYERLHPTGPKHNYKYHTEAMDRAIQGGIDDVSLGVLFGLEDYKYEFPALLMHAEHLESTYGVGPHAVSIPRIRKADGINPDDFEHAIDDKTFEKIVACIRIALPYTGMIVSTRESQSVREKVLELGVSQISGGSKTSVGGYTHSDEETESSAQFDVTDTRTLDDIVHWLMNLGHMPSFCTACYRAGRTGEDFMKICKEKQIHNFCSPNAIITLKEYLEDYATTPTKEKGQLILEEEINKIENNKIRELVKDYLTKIEHGERDFRL